jgi:DNA (cytosine-5)-methyltransferase 1
LSHAKWNWPQSPATAGFSLSDTKGHTKMKIEAVDLFCGIGGLTYGLNKAGIDVVAGIDNDESCKASFEANNEAEFILADVAEYKFKDLKAHFSKKSVKVLVGCAPCQPFSAHSRKRKNRKADSRWHLIEYFLDAVRTLKPQVVSMENVVGLAKTRVFGSFVRELKKLGYEVDFKSVYCPNYGIPQSRRRLVLLASKLGEIKIPGPTHNKEEYMTVREAIGDLPRIRAGGADPKDNVHKAKNLSPLNMARIRQSKQKGTWRDWNKKLLPKCYLKESGSSYHNVYGRMQWDDVAPTMTTQFFSYGTGRFGHPVQNRAISVREGALLQSFPRKYKFDKSVSLTVMGRQIGNAVPPKLGEVIGKAIQGHIRGYYGKDKRVLV